MSTAQNVKCPLCDHHVVFLAMEDYSHAKCEGPDHHEFEIVDVYQDHEGGEVKLRPITDYPDCPKGRIFHIDLEPTTDRTDPAPQLQPAP